MMRKSKAKREGLFEILLREFMAGRMSSKQGNDKLRALMRRARKDAWEQGLDCRIHWKEWNKTKSTTKCTFEKCCN